MTGEIQADSVENCGIIGRRIQDYHVSLNIVPSHQTHSFSKVVTTKFQVKKNVLNRPNKRKLKSSQNKSSLSGTRQTKENIDSNRMMPSHRSSMSRTE